MRNKRKVLKLLVYPVKSLSGISPTNAEVTERGFHLDRRWMLVDKNGVFITQREFPEMALIQVNPNEEGLKVYHKKHPKQSLFVPFDIALTEGVNVKVWSDHCHARELSDEANQWFSEHIGVDCRLVYMPDDAPRSVDARYSPVKGNVSFADGFQFLLANQKSMDDLNTKMKRKFSVDRFRPNIVIDGQTPYEEDEWKKIRIGEIDFHVVKPCSRCVIPTIDPVNGKKSKEPLATLSAYRKQNGKILFGQNMVPDNTGTINVGDEVEVLETKS